MTLLTTMAVPFITDDVVHRKEIARWMASVQPTIDAMASLSAIASAQPWIIATQPPYNAPHNGTDIVPALSAIAADVGSGGAVVMLPGLAGYSFLIDQNYTMPRNLQLRGTHVFNGVPGTNGFTDYSSVNGRLYVGSAATITMKGNCGIDGFLIMRKGLVPPVNDSSAFTGTCIKIVEDDAFVTHCQIMGFNLAVYATGAQRPVICYNTLDNINNIQVEICFDIAKVHLNHAWPFATIAGSGGVPGLHRSGFSYRLNDGGDWNKLNDNFCYGYFRGYQLINVNNVTMAGCAADNTQQNTGSVAFEMKGNCSGTNLIGCQGAAQDHAIHVSTSLSYSTQITNFQAWGTVIDGLLVNQGRVTVTNSWFRDGSYGAALNHGANGFVAIDNTYFEGQTTRPIQCNVSTSNLEVTNIRISPTIPIIASAHLMPQLSVSATLTPIVAHKMYDLLGSGTVESVLGMWAGRELTFVVNADTVIFKHSFNQFGVALAGAANFTASNAAMISFMCNGTLWIEKSRKL